MRSNIAAITDSSNGFVICCVELVVCWDTLCSGRCGAIDSALKGTKEKDAQHESGSRIIDLVSTDPTSAAHIVAAMDTKVWQKNRLSLGGFIGDILFKWSERKFGAVKQTEPTLSMFFEASTLGRKEPAEGIPVVSIGTEMGHKVDVSGAL